MTQIYRWFIVGPTLLADSCPEARMCQSNSGIFGLGCLSGGQRSVGRPEAEREGQRTRTFVNTGALIDIDELGVFKEFTRAVDNGGKNICCRNRGGNDKTHVLGSSRHGLNLLSTVGNPRVSDDSIEVNFEGGDDPGKVEVLGDGRQQFAGIAHDL